MSGVLVSGLKKQKDFSPFFYSRERDLMDSQWTYCERRVRSFLFVFFFAKN